MPGRRPMHAIQTPQTADGQIVKARQRKDGDVEVDVAIPLTPEFSALIDGRADCLVFAARSRMARLGIEAVPQGPVELGAREAHLTVRVTPTLAEYDVGRHLPAVFLPGLAVGRLVFCPAERRLSSEELFQEASRHSLQLPRDFSIDGAGRFIIRPHRRVYDLQRPLSKEELLMILTQFDGREILNRLQLPRKVEHVVLPPRGGVITSCSMFLHRHYAVLLPDEDRGGRHLAAVVLDPISTRGTNIFLEFANPSDAPIINPFVAAELYHASEVETSAQVVAPHPDGAPSAAAQSPRPLAYKTARAAFDELEAGVPKSYGNRLVAAFAGTGELRELHSVWRERENASTSIHDVAATRDFTSGDIVERFGTRILLDLPEGFGGTALLGYFPNLVEHVQICQAVLSGRIKRLVFRRPSYGHGSFFSSNDHSRLADYAALGLPVLWCNDDREHVAQHHFRGLRGYFMESGEVERFKSALVVAVYGSTALLPPAEAKKLVDLLTELKALFGGDLAILTGGGPGAMQQATEAALELDLLVGANYIETVDQPTNKLAQFYQCFQGRSRHVRQRWFEISSFQVFCLGGLGTLEEIGLTLTDMKLGVIEQSPLVFYGSDGEGLYWRHIDRQFKLMADAGRGPQWLKDKILVTDDPGEISAFYKRILELG